MSQDPTSPVRKNVPHGVREKASKISHRRVCRARLRYDHIARPVGIERSTTERCSLATHAAVVCIVKPVGLGDIVGGVVDDVHVLATDF